MAPARVVSGRVRVPGDKSISQRYALLAAIADGPSPITGYSAGADSWSALACVERLGVTVRREGPDAVTLIGRGLGHLRSPDGPLDAGNSGTAMRLLTGLLAGEPFRTVLVGDESLSRRPMRRVLEPLQRMGARIAAVDGHAPLTIDGTRLHGVRHELTVASAQVKSAILLAGLHAEGETTVVEPAATRDHTERALAAFGVGVRAAGRTICVSGGERLTPQSLSVPGDFSSAAYWLVAAAALPGSRIEVEGVGLNPTRTALLDVLRRFGARVVVHEQATVAGEPRGTIVVEADGRQPIEITPAEVPGLIDELPAIAALAAYGGEVTVRGAGELRVKESDRIAALVAGFLHLGIAADELPDGFVIRGDGAPAGGTADARGDHRLAMTFAIAALAAERPSTIVGADSVAISYPGFFETLEAVVTPGARSRA